MSENWRLKLEETCFDDLSQDDRLKLIDAMEKDSDLRKAIISELRFDSVLRETLRTEESSAYQKELSQTWSPENVHREMQSLGMNPKPLESQLSADFKPKWLLLIVTAFLVVGIALAIFAPNTSLKDSSRPFTEISQDEGGIRALGELLLERNGKKQTVKKANLLNGDLLSTNETGWGELALEDGVFIEMGRQAKIKWVLHDGYKEIQLLSGSITATFAKGKLENSKVILSTKFLKTLGGGFKIRASHKKVQSEIEVLEGRLELSSQLKSKTDMARSGDIWQFLSSGEVVLVKDTREKLDADLVAWWSMDDGQGKTINDFSGSGFQGSLASHVKLVEGLRGQALKISEINRKNLVIPHSPELNIHPKNGITVMSWIKTTRIDTATILDKRFGQRKGGKYFGYQMVLVNGELSFQMDDGRTLMFRSKHFVADGTWHHICVSVMRGDVEKGIFYVDGIEVGSFDSKTIGNTDSPGALNIGGHVDQDEHAFVGYIDEVRVYRRGLSQAEIQSVMNQTD
jgi:hypothetical protein